MVMNNSSRSKRCQLACLALPCLALVLACGSGASTGTAPTITSFSPGFGPVSTTQVTVTGSGFGNGVNGVAVGGVGVASANGAVLSDAMLTLLVPTNAVTGPITVATPSGTATSATNFIVTPVITNISPTTGSVAAGTPVTITGSGLMGITHIAFGATAATPTTQNANTIIVPVPAGTTNGVVTITYTVDPTYGMLNLTSQFTVTP